MEFFETVRRRRSVRRYTTTTVPTEVMDNAFSAAQLAPNSSNLQTWEFFWIKTQDTKNKLAEICLNQSAARTAAELVVVVANPNLWKSNNQKLIQLLKDKNSPEFMFPYYKKIVPFFYAMSWLSPIRWLIINTIAIFRPFMRHPWSWRDIQEVSIKSAALAAENFMLAITAQDFDTCPMEGFDESRAKSILKLTRGSRIVMVIAVGERDPKGIWGDQIRFEKESFLKII